ncbi:MAG: ABC transporter ATP-binding protein [Archangium gephyra]|uniref:ABC transporter ATP-binding protein n=1 Tax=Archangium gephyra TaxID=48 RepID=A0A2W5TA94_9BACT|nr:MAG: ABC transporter ATP-binding protein [Archangium gephyra]
MVPALELEDVNAGYGGARVLESVSFTVSPGQAWVVLGPNGAGKSTLVRVAMGMLPPTRGRARVCGADVVSAAPRELSRRVAWVPQVVDEATGFTGLEVALMGRAPHLSSWSAPGTADEARAREVLSALDVGHVADRPLSQVSGGERRRVWLARALLQAPKLLVLDEPTAFLDVRHQVETLRVVKSKVEQGLAVLAVLHDVNLARALATHVVLLKAGKVLASGPVADVLTTERLSGLYDIEMSREPAFVPRWTP